VANEKKAAAVAFMASPLDELLVVGLLAGLGYVVYRQVTKPPKEVTGEQDAATQSVMSSTNVTDLGFNTDPGNIDASFGGTNPQGQPAPSPNVLKWLLGIGGVWIVLTLMVDLGDTADLATALALVIMGSVVLEKGPDVFTSLGISTAAPAATTGG
jgi:hypothetical protein